MQITLAENNKHARNASRCFILFGFGTKYKIKLAVLPRQQQTQMLIVLVLFHDK